MTWINKYIEVLLKVGLNLQGDEILLLRLPETLLWLIEPFEAQCRLMGVKSIVVDGISEESLMAFTSVIPLSQIPQSFLKSAIEKLRLAMIHIDMPYSVLSSPARGYASEKNAYFLEAYDAGRISYVKTILPCIEWASKVFPELKEPDALMALEKAFAHFCRLDAENPVEAWKRHQQKLKKIRKRLEELTLKIIRFKNSGCDCFFELHDNCSWIGGETVNPFTKKYYLPNIPSEEIFTVPKRLGVNGILRTSRPLFYDNQLVQEIELEIQNGKVIRAQAEEGEKVLKEIITHDEGSAYLGELAIVPASSPIGRENRIFFNTLVDENAGCHVALGKGSPSVLPGGFLLGRKELLEKGINNSNLHVDLVVGNGKFEVTGWDYEGNECCILKKGEWALLEEH